jgi:hypothetical protein
MSWDTSCRSKFNFTSGFYGSLNSITGDVVANLRDLIEELKDLTDWFNFGIYLGIHQEELMVIGKDYSMDTERCKIETLIVWMKRELPTWSKVIQALVRIEMLTLAQKIAECHG